MKSKTIFLSAAATGLLLISSLPANAFSTSVTAGSFSSQAGALTIDFGTSTATNGGPVVSGPGTIYSSTSGGVTYDYTGGALYNLITSPISGITARPVGSVDNFWSVGQGVQSGPGVVTFSTGLSYFGFLWGSPDTYNTVSFYDGNNVLASFTGAAVLNPADGNQAVAGYFNAFAGPNEKITKVTFDSTQNAFETDNHAFIAAVPEPETYGMMMAGLGLMGVWMRRRKNNFLS